MEFLLQLLAEMLQAEKHIENPNGIEELKLIESDEKETVEDFFSVMHFH